VKEVSSINEEIYKQEPETPSFLWTIPVDGDRKTILVFELYDPFSPLIMADTKIEMLFITFTSKVNLILI